MRRKRNGNAGACATAIPVGAEQHLGKGNNTLIQPGVVADMARLHFCPLRPMLMDRRLFQYGQASAPRG